MDKNVITIFYMLPKVNFERLIRTYHSILTTLVIQIVLIEAFVKVSCVPCNVVLFYSSSLKNKKIWISLTLIY